MSRIGFLPKKIRNLLNFFLSNVNIQKEIMVQQIALADITIDRSPYYLILDFHYDALPINRLTAYEKYPDYPTLVVSHDHGAPTVFILHFKDGIISEFEIFNADSSFMDIDSLCKGEVDQEFM